ncbi:hypothetical protein F5Y06DRAFT_13483 [Hypoxylon sp. FL0890]|nr:hypothetical protein F5Y06DRAFT_13483 [Hypoxylon sp. FL0890]
MPNKSTAPSAPIPTQGPPAWLFSNNSNSSSAPLPSTNTAPTMAKKTQKPQKSVKPTASSASRDDTPPAQLMDLVESFLSDQGFDNAHREFQKHRAKKGWKEQGSKKHKDKTHHSLVSVFQTWKTFSSQGNTPVLPKEDPMQKITKVSSDSSDSSDDSSSESESDSDSDDVAMADAPAAEQSSSSESSSSDDSDSESESDEEAKPTKSVPPAVKNGVNPLKRKAESDSESSSESDSDDDMSDSSSEDERPQAKRAKTTESSDESSSSSSSDSSEDESSEDEDEAKPKSKADDDDDESSSSSESESDDSDSESDAEPKVDLKEAAQVPLPESDSSSSESESESDSDEKAQGQPKDSSGSDTSVTLDKVSPDAPLPPDPTTLKSNNRGKNGAKNGKGQNQPFSRIRKDVEVDPRLSSNAYVSHGYGEKAHQDLIVTKGKGFTKEKNKKKRGSYKGGPLDIHKSRSIKFED